MKKGKLATASEAAIDQPTHVLPHRQLTGFEFHLLLRIACGQPQAEIAKVLCISIETVRLQRAAILEKMKVPHEAALTSYAVAQKLIDLE